AHLRSAKAGGNGLIARFETRHGGQEFFHAVLVELDAWVVVLDGNNRSQTVGGFYDPGTNIEPLHYGLLRAERPRLPPQTLEYPIFRRSVNRKRVWYSFDPHG